MTSSVTTLPAVQSYENIQQFSTDLNEANEQSNQTQTNQDKPLSVFQKTMVASIATSAFSLGLSFSREHHVTAAFVGGISMVIAIAGLAKKWLC